MSNKIERVLAAIDFSDTTEPIVECLLEMHHTFAPQFVLLHVLTDDVMGHLKRSSSMGKEKAREFAISEVAPLWKKLEEHFLPEEVDFRKEYREGLPHKAIPQCAEDLDCQLIVMGYHLRSGFQQMLLGNTPKNILNSTSLPLVLVRPKKN